MTLEPNAVEVKRWMISKLSTGPKEFRENLVAGPDCQYVEVLSVADHARIVKNLKSIIAKEVSENDEFGSEFVLVNILKSELETARRVREKLTEQRNDYVAEHRHLVDYYDRAKTVSENINKEVEKLDAEIAAIENAPKILEDTGGGSGRMEILEVHGDEKDGTK